MEVSSSHPIGWRRGHLNLAARTASATDAVVLVTAGSVEEKDASMLEVRSESCRTIDLSDDPGMDTATSWGLSCFGALEEDAEKQAQELVVRTRPRELVAVVADSEEDAPGDFDVCREYGYKYEYAQDEEDDDDDEDEIEQQEVTAETAVPILALDVSTSMAAAPETATKEVKFVSHLLGKSYHPVLEYATRRADESSLFWFTYRCDFPEIVPYRITTDAGWGCMLRSAQMMLGQALRLHYQGRDWHPPKSIAKRRSDPFLRNMLTWFADFPSQTECRYSLHNMVAAGLSRYETLPGEWYGPGTACYVLRDLCQLHEQEEKPNRPMEEGNLNRPMFRVYVAPQGTVYRDAVEDLMTSDTRKRESEERKKSTEAVQEHLSHPLDPRYCQEQTAEKLEWDTALLILVPLRLGLKSFNEVYALALAHIFAFRQSVGVLGGRPRTARWFYGAASNGSQLYGLDPHTVQNAPRRTKPRNGKSTVALTEEYIRSVHCSDPEVVNLRRMDPSLALGFYCRDRADFEHLCNSLQRWKDSKPSSIPDLFSVAEAVPDYSADVSSVMNDLMLSAMSCSEGAMDNHTGESFLADNGRADISDEDDYVML